MCKQNYNSVDIHIPTKDEYIVIIGNDMLVVKKIDDSLYQYSEFTKFTNNYRMTGVNCDSKKSYTRVMEEFCQNHGSTKKLFKEALDKALDNFNLVSEMRRVDYDKYNDALLEVGSLTNELNTVKEKLESITGLTVDLYTDLAMMLSKFMAIEKISGIKFIDTLENILNVKIVNDNNKRSEILKISDDNSDDKNSKVLDTSDDPWDFAYDLFVKFMRNHTKRKPESKCLISKFYTEFCKVIEPHGY